ncbi:unnamed protein product [Adineta ricciae]|uniref:Uncharacterized protein n=1 Tax=Adineta ricciae TaxID=249248 RepID=A0A814UMG3_ADIRI|nr:unnamed protein product [Adineta ricciae]CAF1179206.1 unnamed protein product [Adineta ricciae]
MEDFKQYHRSRKRWLKEQQIIRKNYQLSSNTPYLYTFTFHRPIPNHEKIVVTNENRQSKHDPPMFCSSCYLHLTQCVCNDGLGQWWANSKEQTQSANKLSKQSSNLSMGERHVNFDSSAIDFTSIDHKHTSQTNRTEEYYVLLNWNNYSSLINFFRTTKITKSFSSMTLEQLQQLVANNEHIHVFNSINTLLLSLNERQSQPKMTYLIYIDPTYYSALQGSSPWSQSRLIADNIDLTRSLSSIQYVVRSLGVTIDEFLPKDISPKQRKSILNQQTSLIASKLPYSTRHAPSSSI